MRKKLGPVEVESAKRGLPEGWTRATVIVREEFMEKVKSKAFITSLVLMPLIMVVFGVLPGLLASSRRMANPTTRLM